MYTVQYKDYRLGLWHKKSRDTKIIFKRILYPYKKDIVVVVLKEGKYQNFGGLFSTYFAV